MACCCQPTRRQLLEITTLGVAAAGFAASTAMRAGAVPVDLEWDPDQPILCTGKTLTVQPLLRHQIETQKPQTSWRNWGGVHTEEAVADELARIGRELAALEQQADFPLKVLPVETARSDEEAQRIRDRSGIDVLLLYAAGAQSLDPCLSPARHNLIFVRHRSGPVYDWYENAHNRFLRVGGKNFEYDNLRNFAGMDHQDIVVDAYDDILVRLRAIYGVENLLGKKIVSLGRPGGKGCPRAPEVAQTKFKLAIESVTYEDLERRLLSLKNDAAVQRKTDEWTTRYLGIPRTKLETEREYIRRCFVLYIAFKQYLQESGAAAFTINQCMSTVMPASETTACLPLSLLNDEGYLAFCESDFVVIPSGILLHYASGGKPVFLHNPAFPHHGMVTCAHCTGPRRMDGHSYFPARIVTHYESDYGAAPKVELPLGDTITLVDPDTRQERWVGMRGTVDANPFYEICRSQQDVRIDGDWKRLIPEIRGSHWMMAHGDYLREVAYATKKLGIGWLNISES